MFHIEDELHDERIGSSLSTFEDAFAELRRLAQLAWD
jgi:hypothetical protein